MIFFDIDDTLLDNQKAELAAAKDFHLLYKDIFPVSFDEFALNWRSVTDKHVQRYLSGELSFQDQRRERLRELFSHNRMLSDDEADYIFQKYLNCYENNWTLFSDVLFILDHFTGSHLGVISNGDSRQQRQKLTSTGIIDRFSIVIISGDIGVFKPDPQIFKEACSMAGVEPSECWYIGNNFEADLKGSLSVGMNGIWLNRNDNGSTQGVTTIKSLLDLKDIIGAHNKQRISNRVRGTSARC